MMAGIIIPKAVVVQYMGPGGKVCMIHINADVSAVNNHAGGVPCNTQSPIRHYGLTHGMMVQRNMVV